MRRRRIRPSVEPSSILPSLENESRYHLSSESGHHVRFFLGSLEVPNPTIPLHETGMGSLTGPSSSPSSANALRDNKDGLYVTVQLIGNGRPLHAVPQQSKMSMGTSEMRAQGKEMKMGLHCPQSKIHFWEEWLHLPVLYCSLPRSARFLFKMYDLNHDLVCSTSMCVFDEKGSMRMGLQKLLLWPARYNGRRKRGGYLSEPASNIDEGHVVLPADGCLPDKLHDVRFRHRRLREVNGRGDGIVYPGDVHWLDRAMDAYEQALSFSTLQPLEARVALPKTHPFHRDPMFLHIATPRTLHPILFEEMLYQRAGASANGLQADIAGGETGRVNAGELRSSFISGDPRLTGCGISASTWLRRLEESEKFDKAEDFSMNNGVNNTAGRPMQSPLSAGSYDSHMASTQGSGIHDTDVDEEQGKLLTRYCYPYTQVPKNQFNRIAAENNSQRWTQSLSLVVDHSFAAGGMDFSSTSTPTSSTSTASSFSSLSPVEAMYSKLSRGNESRGQANPQLLKPDKSEREAIERIIALPNDDLVQAERQLLWRFRYSLVSEGKAIVKFVLIVDWNGDVDEARLGEELLSRWAPIGADSALKLLSARFKRVPAVRIHAIKALDRLPDDELCLYLLQLVQALRYEDLPPLQEGRSADNGPEDTSSPGDPEKAVTTNNEDDFMTGEEVSDHTRALSACPLLSFLAMRATKSVELATLLHWYLTVETEDTKLGPHFTRILDILGRTLQVSGGSLGREIAESIRAQKALVYRLRATLKHAIGTKRSTTERKVLKLRQALQPGGFAEDLAKVDVVLPLDTSVQLTGIVPETATMFASATYPMALEWYTKPATIGAGQQKLSPVAVNPISQSRVIADNRDSTGSSTEIDKDISEEEATHLSTDSFTLMQNESMRMVHAFFEPQQKVKFVYKGGDDMRQDQLVIQLIGLIDRLFKRVNLDLRLTPFKVISTSRNDGLMEFIDGALTITKILKDYGKNIQTFFRKHHPAPAPAKYGIDPEVMENFIRSSAGYCVITFVLAIGDRHLENLMIKPSGHLIHIDFGWIFGRDPKPWPSPMRLIPQMVAAMGGSESEDYARFKLYCCQAYRIMRSNAKLICNLLSLMADAGIKDLSIEQDPAAVILKVQDRLRLDLVDGASAEAFLIARLDESVSGLAPRVADFVHAVAVSMRG